MEVNRKVRISKFLVSTAVLRIITFVFYVNIFSILYFCNEYRLESNIGSFPFSQFFFPYRDKVRNWRSVLNCFELSYFPSLQQSCLIDNLNII